jgi:circadian clock protein KaiC
MAHKHEETVDACFERLRRDVSPEAFEQIFGKLVAALWIRSSRTLSVVTLDAIFERSLSLTQSRFPLFASFALEYKEGLFQGFLRSAAVTADPQLIECFRYFLVTLLTLFGNLTADILLTALYRELQTFALQPNELGPLSQPAETASVTSSTALIAKRPVEQFNSNEPAGVQKRKAMRDNKISLERVMTHISNLDEILGGGLPKGSITILAGPPGTGKTILSQQICFTNASPDDRALFIQTLSEPTAKTLKFMSQFNFYDPRKLEDGSVEFVDLGGIVRTKGLQEGVDMLMKHVRRVKPAFVVIDSFKVFEDLAHTREELRKFSYEVAVNLMAWECTALLLGEFNTSEMESNPVFSIVDGLVRLKLREESGEDQRFLQIVKMRGTDHSRDDHTMAITETGIGIYAPRVTIRREMEPPRTGTGTGPVRVRLGISRLDDLLGEGVPAGSSFIISGVAGTGKTLLSLEFIYRGAKDSGEKGIYFSFEETADRLIAEAKGMGWDLESLVNSGMIEIVFIPQPDIIVEKHLLMMSDRINKLKAKRIAIDSASLFVHKLAEPQAVREKIFQLATLVQKTQGIGFFATDVPYGSNRLSRFGVEETVVDGVILLTASERAYGRERFIEIYKLRNTAHADGRHKMEITGQGIVITPRPHSLPHDEGLKKKRDATKAA